MKEKFINILIWQSTFAGAFQRARIYKPEINHLNKDRIAFRKEISDLINEIGENSYKKESPEVSSDEHIENIIIIQNHINNSSHAQILTEDRIRVGIVQKIFNLYLKYQWCLGNYSEPPHCPFDRIIINELAKHEYKNQFGDFEPVNWTKFDNIITYKKLIERAQKVVELEKANSLAQWELQVYDKLTT